jgi:hypothetical protein
LTCNVLQRHLLHILLNKNRIFVAWKSGNKGMRLIIIKDVRKQFTMCLIMATSGLAIVSNCPHHTMIQVGLSLEKMTCQGVWWHIVVGSCHSIICVSPVHVYSAPGSSSWWWYVHKRLFWPSSRLGLAQRVDTGMGMGMLKSTYGLPVPLPINRHIWVSPVGLVVAPLGHQKMDWSRPLNTRY